MTEKSNNTVKETENMSTKIYYIVHISELQNIIDDGFIFSFAEILKRQKEGIVIGLNKLKKRRLTNPVKSHLGLSVGDCVPFYFCPRSVMLFIIHKKNHPDLTYREGQEPIVHLVADLNKTIDWADSNKIRWAFTDSNASSSYFRDYFDINDLDKIDWTAINAKIWNESPIEEKKQAEFLIENRFPFELVEEIGVYSEKQLEEISIISKKLPCIKIRKDWFY